MVAATAGALRKPQPMSCRGADRRRRARRRHRHRRAAPAAMRPPRSAAAGAAQAEPQPERTAEDAGARRTPCVGIERASGRWPSSIPSSDMRERESLARELRAAGGRRIRTLVSHCAVGRQHDRIGRSSRSCRPRSRAPSPRRRGSSRASTPARVARAWSCPHPGRRGQLQAADDVAMASVVVTTIRLTSRAAGNDLHAHAGRDLAECVGDGLDAELRSA